MERPHWSFSAINQFLRCPLQYYFERVLRLPRSSVSSSLVFGSSVHHALAIYHNALQKNTSVTLDELKIGIREIWAKEGAMKKIDFKSGELLEHSVEQAITLIELYAREPQPTDIVCVEKRMTVPLQNSDGDILEKPLVAVADLICRPNNGILITEFKTAAKAYSEFEVDSSLQPSCYVNASLELFGEIANVEFAILVKTKTPKIQRLRTIRDAKDLGRLGDLVETIEHSVVNQNYYPIESTMNCSSCYYRKECRLWKPKRSAANEKKLVPLNGVHACWPN